jgi:hypothetical protein
MRPNDDQQMNRRKTKSPRYHFDKRGLSKDGFLYLPSIQEVISPSSGLVLGPITLSI